MALLETTRFSIFRKSYLHAFFAYINLNKKHLYSKTIFYEWKEKITKRDTEAQVKEVATEEDSRQAEATTRWEVETGDPRLRMVAMEDMATSTASARISTGSTKTTVLSTSPTPKTMTTTGIKTEIGLTEKSADPACEVKGS